MKRYGFDLQEPDATNSTLGLLEDGRFRKPSYRLLIGIIVVLVVLCIALGVALGVTLNKSSNTTPLVHNTPPPSTSTSPQTSRSTKPSPTLDKTSQSTKPSPTLTTTDHGKNWLQEPCQPQQPLTCPWSSNPVLLVSLDGFRAEYLTRKLTPTLQKLTTCGVHTPYMRSVYPTLTFPNHYTIVTGLYPESHGIVDNNMYDPEINAKFSLRGTEKMNPAWWGGEPIWITAKHQGKKTASYFWVGADVNISGVMPDIYHAYDGSITFETRVDTVLQWLSQSDRPDLITLYFDEPDHVGHGSGPDSLEVDAMLGRIDTVINRLMDGLYRRQIHNCVNVIVLADHGMESTSCDRRVFLNKYVDVKKLLIFDGTIGRIHRQFYEEKVGKNYVVKKNSTALPLEDLEKLLKCKSEHIQMFDKTNIPIRHHYMNNQRIGDLILDMQTRWTVARSGKTYCLKGNHGFDNLYKSMQALFIAHGPDFKQKIQTDPFENIELYNLLCELLKINPAPNNGTMGTLNHILRSPNPLPTSHTTVSPSCHNGTKSATDKCFCSTMVDPLLFNTNNYTSPFGQPEVTSSNDVCLLTNNDTASGYSKHLHMPVWTSFILYKNKNKMTLYTIDLSSMLSNCNNVNSRVLLIPVEGNDTIKLNKTTGSCVYMDPRIHNLPCHTYSNSNQSISHHLIFNAGFSVVNSGIENSLSSGIVPMYDGFRDGIWDYTLKLIIDYASQRQGMEIIMGPAFDNNKDGIVDKDSTGMKMVNDGAVPLPTHYYIMVIACKQGGITHCKNDDIELLSFILPHVPVVPNCMPDVDYLMENVARIKDIELLTGIQFLTKLPGGLSARLKTFLPTSLWKPSNKALKWKDLPCSAPQTASCPGKVPLLLISLDGFRADYVTRNLTPVIQKLRTCGVHTPYMRSVYPTVTFPNHYTIATGLYPESHGIISNNMYDGKIGEVFTLSSKTKADPRWWGGEPIWNTAKKRGKKPFTFFWPGSDVNISGSYPDKWVGYDGQIGFPERLETVLEWLTLPEDKRPDIVTLYFDEPDHAGHAKGPDSDMVNGQLETVDAILGRLMDSLYQQNLQDCVNIIVIADHGMDDVSCSNVVKLPQYMPGDVKKILVFDGTFGRIENEYERISKYKVKTENVSHVPVPKLIDQLMCKNPAMKVFTKETVPKRYHYFNNKRIGDILLDLQDRWLVSDTNGFYCTGGNHGWDNLEKSMHALFLAHGPVFKQQLEIDPFENIELYNLMSEIIGITPAPNNGTVGTLHHILSNASKIPQVSPANQTSRNITHPVPVCGCVSLNLSLYNLLPSLSGSLPFGVPVSSHGHIHTNFYPKFTSGYSDRSPLWTTASVTQNKSNHAVTCFVNDMESLDLSCDDYRNKEKNISLQTLYNTDSPKAEVHFLSSAVPMYDGFKNGIWKYVWQLSQDYRVRYGDISVTTGPIYDYNGDGLVDLLFDNTSFVNRNSTVILPTHFYMIMMKCKNNSQKLPCTSNSDVDVQSFILPHLQTAPNCLYNLEYLQDNVGRIRDIELLTGLQFLTENIDQALAARLRTYLPVNLWPADITETWLNKPCPSHQDTCKSDYHPLILVSLDGFRADYLLRNFTPYVKKLSQCGVHAPYMRSVYPTKTFPNHYSIVTGLYPESHGIIDNNMYDDSIGSMFGIGKKNASDPRWWGGEPFWNTVEKNNKTSATYFWPGSDVQIEGMYPNIWKKYDGKVPFLSRVDELLTWLDLPTQERPDFITLYFDEPDHAGHSYGPDDIAKIGVALNSVDEAIGRLMEGLYHKDLHNCANIIIVADHGMSDTSCDRLITVTDYITEYRNMYIYEGAFGRINPYISYGKKHPMPVINPVPVSNIMANMSCKTTHFKVFEKSQLPKRHHYANNKRIDDIIVDVEDKWLFTYRKLEGYKKRFCVGGTHGYDNIYKSMNALFLAYGTSFKQNLTVEPFENIELYNLMSTVLNITGAPNNGTDGSLYKLLRNPPKDVTVPQSMDYIRNSSDIVNSTLSTECLKRCPSYRNLNKSESNRRNVTEKKHIPFGIPLLQSFPRSFVDLLYQPTHITGYDTDVKTPVWVSYTLQSGVRTSSSTVKPSCVLPDQRVETISVNKKICSVAINLPSNYTWTTLSVKDNQQSTEYDRISSMYVPVYKTFNLGIWSGMKEKITQWLSKYSMLNIISGPAYDYNYDGLPDSIDTINRYTNDTDILIPSHIFLIITRCEDKGSSHFTTCSSLKTMSFILPNIQHDNNCQVTDNYLTDNEARIRDIELLTGLQFFTGHKNHVLLRTFLPHGLWTI